MKVSMYDRMILFFDPEYYRVFQNMKVKNKKANKGSRNIEKDLHYLAVNPDKATYKIQFLNIDIQKDATLNIKLTDKSGNPMLVPASSISTSNLSFEFGVK
jgi:hypothetical protein